MSNLSVNISDTLLHRLLSVALAKKIPLNDYICDVLSCNVLDALDVHEVPDTSNMNSIAVDRATAKAVGDKFTLQDLFPNDCEWANVQKPRVFGRVFRQMVESGNAPIARHIGVTKQNKAIYERM